ncbi:MAG: sporulation histidine kinase inhibitor Sda [Sporolactobacillus sp.]
MENIPDDLLIESYLKARQYKLNDEFIHLIEDEMRRRNLTVSHAR